METYQRLKEAKPADLATLRLPVPVVVDAAVAATFKNEGIEDMGRFFMHQLFLAGLREDIRLKTMEAGETTLQASLNSARQFEVILNDKKGRSQITSIVEEEAETDDDPHEAPFPGEEAEAYCERVNAIRRKQGKPLLRFGKSSNFRKRNPDLVCYYCNKKGHPQKNCRERIKKGANMVDWRNKKSTNAIQEQTKENGDSETKTVNSLSLLDYYGVNSISSSHLN
jgi:hypothetical protein